MTNQTFVPGGEVTSDDKLWSLLSYLIAPIVPIIVLLMEDKKSRPFIKYHAMQALVLSLVIYIGSAILSFVFVGICTGLAGAVYLIYLAVKSYQGEYVVIPVVTDFCKKQGWIA
jgi:uncharacterized protein